MVPCKYVIACNYWRTHLVCHLQLLLQQSIEVCDSHVNISQSHKNTLAGCHSCFVLTSINSHGPCFQAWLVKRGLKYSTLVLCCNMLLLVQTSGYSYVRRSTAADSNCLSFTALTRSTPVRAYISSACDDREFTEVTSLRELTMVSSQSYSWLWGADAEVKF